MYPAQLPLGHTRVPSAHKKATTTTVFLFIRTGKSLRGNYWTECDSGDSRQERKQLEGLPGPVRPQRSCVFRDVVFRRRAEREASGGAVGRGSARDGRVRGEG